MTKEQATRLLGKIAGYLEILRKDPHSTTFVPLSDAYRNLGMLEDAISVAQSGIEALPFFGPGYVVLGRAQMQCGELDNAALSFDKALEIDPDSVVALKSMAKLCVIQGDKERACRLLARAVALSPEDPVLANLHKSLQPACEASSNSVCEGTGISKDSEDQSLFATATVADLYVRQGYLDKARNIYQELLQAHPDDETFRERIAYVDKLLAEQPSLTDSDSASSMRLGVEHPQSPDSQRDVVAILQKWLKAIQSRREYVQKHSAGHC